MSRLISCVLVVLALLVGAVCVGGAGEAGAAGADERLTVGLKAFQDRFYSLAVKELRAFLDASPEDPRRGRVLQVLAQAEIGQENWDGARGVLEQVLGGGGDPREVLHQLVWVSARQGDGPAAARFAERFAGLPGNGAGQLGDVLELAARAAWQDEQYGTAARLYRRFLDGVPADPRRPAIWAGRVAALEQIGGNPEGVLGAVNGALGEGVPDGALRATVAEAGVRAARDSGNPRREAELWRVLAGAATDPTLVRRALLETGLASARAGDGAVAEKALKAFVERHPTGEDAAQAHLTLADLARGGENWEAVRFHLEAVLSLPEGVRAGRSDAELHRGALAAALRTGDETGAAPHAEALLSADAELAAEELGALHLLLGRRAADRDPAAAVGHWLKVPEAAPQYRDARLAAAALLTETGKTRQALAVVQPLLAAYPADSGVQRVALAAAEGAGEWERAALLADALVAGTPPGAQQRALARRAALHWLQAGDAGGYERALEGLAAGGAGDEVGTWAAAELHRLTFRRGEWESSVAWALRAGDSPTEELALRHAEALEKLGRDPEALAVLQLVADRKGPQAGAALARIGAVHDRAGHWQQARTAYTLALEAGVPDAAAELVRQRLEQLKLPSAPAYQGPATGQPPAEETR